MSNIPRDPHMLYSYINLNLRDDEYDSLEEFCAARDISPAEIIERLSAAGYIYDKAIKQFR